MKCKFCGEILEDGVTHCPACGKDNAKDSLDMLQKKVKTMRIALGVLLAAVLLAALTAVVVLCVRDGMAPSTEPSVTESKPDPTIPTDGNPDNETAKGTYTAADDALAAGRDTVVAAMGDARLTNGVLGVYYWNSVYDFLSQYGSYAAYLGLDVTLSLDMQPCTMFENEPMTWQQCFLRQAINSWTTYQSVVAEAQKVGFVLPQYYQEALDELPEQLEKTAEENKFESVDAMLKKDYGPSCTYEDYYSYMYTSYVATAYYEHLSENLEISADKIQAYFTENAESLKSQYKIEKLETPLVSIRHILLMPEGGKTDATGNKTYTDAEWEACRKKAQELYDQWLAGDKSEASFGEFAKKHSQDGNASEGGIYEDVYTGMMVTDFNNWCFDAARKTGDHGLVKTPFGYHIMYFVKSYEGPHPTVVDGARSEEMSAYLEELEKANPAQVTYSDILLANIKLS